MKWKKRLSVFMILAALMVFYVNREVFAHDVPDLDRTGSITVSVQYDGDAVPGGTLSLYRAGDVAEDNGNYSFALNAEFEGSQVPLKDPGSDEAAEELASYAEAHSLSARTEQISGEGTAVFRGLEPGLYLLVQYEAAEGYCEMDPFLVSVPILEDGAYVYEIDASPKTETEKAEEPPVPDQPKTGDTESPAPYTMAAGLALCVIGAAGRMLYVRGGNGRYDG